MSITQQTTNGFRVPYKIDNVPDKGKGIIAISPIKRGTLVWNADPNVCQIFTKNEFEDYLSKLNFEQARDEVMHVYGAESVSKNHVILLRGDARIFNHSSNNSVGEWTSIFGNDIEAAQKWAIENCADLNNCTVAIKDIEIGDELSDNYGSYYDPEWLIDLCDKYNVIPSNMIARLYN